MVSSYHYYSRKKNRHRYSNCFRWAVKKQGFFGDLFKKLREGFEEGIARHNTNIERKVYIVGFAKHSIVYVKLRVSIIISCALEKILTGNFSGLFRNTTRYREKKLPLVSEYAREDQQDGEVNKL